MQPARLGGTPPILMDSLYVVEKISQSAYSVTLEFITDIQVVVIDVNYMLTQLTLIMPATNSVLMITEQELMMQLNI